MEDYNLGWQDGFKYAKEKLIELVKSEEFQLNWVHAPSTMTFADFCAEQIKDIS